MTFLKEYIVAFVVFLAIDAVWLGFIAKNIYNKELGFILSPNPNLLAAAVFYLIFIGGLVYFVIHPGLANKDISQVLISGLVFGVVTYATYDLTNMATIANWPLKITIIDMIWGGFLATSVSYITYIILK